VDQPPLSGRIKLVVLGLGHMHPELFPGVRGGRNRSAAEARRASRQSPPPANHRLVIGREEQESAVVDDDLHVALVVLDA